MLKVDIAIIGAGPVGCYTASLLKLYGFQVVLIEDDSAIGKPVHCAGVLGNKIFSSAFDRPMSRSSIINVINGATFHLDTKSFDMCRKEVAYVVDRTLFDQELSSGLDILLKNKFLRLSKQASGYVIETDRQNIQADIVVGADGAESALRGLLANHRDNLFNCKGLQYRVRMKAYKKDFVEVFLKQGFFIWMVPESSDIVRIGTICENAQTELSLFLVERNIGQDNIIETLKGNICVGICDSTVKDNIAIVGGAACQVKPLSYGGVYLGLQCANILANCIKNKRIKDYDYLWKKEYLSGIKIGLSAVNMYNNMLTEDLHTIFDFFNNQKLLIQERGDFENHGKTILDIFSKPTSFKSLGPLAGILLKNIL